MRDGYKIWDTDTHCRPSWETLEPYFDSHLKARLPELQQYKRKIKHSVEGLVAGNHGFALGARYPYPRFLGKATDEPGLNRPESTYMGTRHATEGAMDNDPDVRVKDMDEEGVDAQLIIGGMPNAFHLDDRELQIGLLQAYNRYLNDFCGKHPRRLKAVMPVVPNAINECVAEIRKWGRTPWAVGVYVQMKNDTPMDHPDMEPIWKAVDDEGLVVIHHSNYMAPPYFPGYQDLWGNGFLGRSCAHPWGAMRAIAAFIGCGAMDRYKQLRFGILESGFGYLPFWMRRLEDQVHYVGSTADLEHKFSEYLTGGRFFSSIEMSEGQDMVEMVSQFLGPDVLMYASDYPHYECRFPNSTDYFLKWNLNKDLKRKLLWDNPVRFYGEP